MYLYHKMYNERQGMTEQLRKTDTRNPQQPDVSDVAKMDRCFFFTVFSSTRTVRLKTKEIDSLPISSALVGVMWVQSLFPPLWYLLVLTARTGLLT